MDSQAFAAAAITDGIVTGLDIMHKPEIFNKLVGQFPKQRDLLFLQELGQYEPVKQTEFSWHEENRILASATIAAKATVVANTTVRITLAAEDHYDGGQYSYPRKNDRVEFANGVQGVIISKNTTVNGAHTIDVQRVNATMDPVAAAVVGAKLGIFSMAFAEGGVGYDATIVPKTTTYTAKCQIFRDKFTVTGSEEGNQSWVEFPTPAGLPGVDGKSGFFFVKAQADTYDRFMLKRELGLLTNAQDDGAVIVNAGEPAVRTTRGFIPHVKQYSSLMDYAQKASMTTFDTMIRLLNKNHSDQDNLCLMGLDFALVLKDFGTDIMKNGGVLYNSSSGGAMDSVALGFSTYEFPTTGYKFHFKPLRALSNPDSTGLPGFTYSGLAILCPTSKRQDAKTGEMMAPLCIRYKKPIGGGARGWYKLWETGANASVPTNDVLNRNMEIQSEEAMQVFGAGRFIYCSKAA